MGLTEYRNKRDLTQSPEPEAIIDTTGGGRFVVQRHQARRLHYDLRLEIGGVLKSWAVPKGPSLNPNDKRLAIQTEDHPVSYLTFHGTIPKGNYGAGDMQIWDTGTFRVSSSDDAGQAQKQWQKGVMHLEFAGGRMRGTFSLVRLKESTESSRSGQWLLIKKKDPYAVESAYDAEHQAIQDDAPATLRFIAPMLASTCSKIFDDPGWLYEWKWDGYRMLATVENGAVHLYSRNGLLYNHTYSHIVPTLAAIPHDVILDGEIVVLDRDGRQDFAALKNYSRTPSGELRYYVFDLLHVNGHSTFELPLAQRKSLLLDILTDYAEKSGPVRYCDHVVGQGQKIYAQATGRKMEGVLAKKADSLYRAGIRSKQWLKIKAVAGLEATICGYTESAGGAPFGALILGRYQDARLQHIGNCGSGFTHREQLKLLRKLASLASETSPFQERVNVRGRTVHWVRPQLVCEVQYAEWTKGGRLRHPVYKKLRPDKNPDAIHPVAENAEAEGAKWAEAPNQSGAQSLKVNGIAVPISNPDKIYWPESSLTKYDLIDYYIHIAETILPYLRDRPQSLHRHPDGIARPGFFQKDHDSPPDWVQTVAIHSKSSNREITYLLCQNEAALLYMANLGCIEINSWSSRTGSLNAPDYTVIDLDPSDDNSFDQVIEVAQTAWAILEAAQIEALCKTSGSSGLHIYIPLGAKYSYQEARDFARILCTLIQAQLPTLTSMERAIKNRRGKIYLDYLQNRRGQTLAAPYCLRPRPRAPVSAPLSWNEVKTGLKIDDFTISTMRARLAEKGDIFDRVLGRGIDMLQAVAALEQL